MTGLPVPALQQTEIPATPEHSVELNTTSETKHPTAIKFREAKAATPPEAKHPAAPEAEASISSKPKAATPPPHRQPSPSAPSASVDVIQRASARPSSAQQQPRMGSNIGGDSCSDAETQEPTKPVMRTTPEHVEDSDVEEVTTGAHGGSPDSANGKMRQIIERINADSDRSDDEEQMKDEEEEVDFGDEVEEDMVVNVDEMVEEGKIKGKGKKKEKEGPVKTIKKADAKGKTKSAKGKGSTLLKKKAAAAKGKAASPKASPKTSPKPEKKKASRVTDKGSATADAKPRAKPAAKPSADKEKAVKPKKTISKEEKKVAKKPLLKKNEKKTGAVKTFSKKANAAATKSSPKGKKAATAKKGKTEKATPVKKTKKGKKSKATATPSKSSEEENNESMVVADSEDEENNSDSEEEMEETVRTPGSKLPILGNLACSSRDANASALLDHAVQQLGKYNVVSYGPDSDWNLHAYIIGKETKRGWGLLQALASGVRLVSDDWLSSSISEGKWKPMDVFRSDRFGQSPRSVNMAAQQSRILEGQRIKVISDNKDASSIRKLLSLCGARVAETRMDIVINDSTKPVKGCVNVSKKWLADSVEAGEPLDYDAYVMGA